jgi:WhiB family redox-sensing transcriptional regulator
MAYAEYVARMKALPPTNELAARVRDGLPLRQLAAELHMDPQGLANRFIAAGFHVTGESEKDYRRRQMKEHLKATLRTYAEPWMADAVCAQTDPEAFFPEKGGSTAEAKRVCVSCPVREICLEWALAKRERFGILGGKSERERRKIEQQRKAAA